MSPQSTYAGSLRQVSHLAERKLAEVGVLLMSSLINLQSVLLQTGGLSQDKVVEDGRSLSTARFSTKWCTDVYRFVVSNIRHMSSFSTRLAQMVWGPGAMLPTTQVPGLGSPNSQMPNQRFHCLDRRNGPVISCCYETMMSVQDWLFSPRSTINND